MNGVSLDFSEMETICKSIEDKNVEIMDLKNAVEGFVNSFPDVWNGEAEKNFTEDYQLITSSIQSASGAMEEITTMMRNYINDMRAVEETYGSGPHVSIS